MNYAFVIFLTIFLSLNAFCPFKAEATLSSSCLRLMTSLHGRRNDPRKILSQNEFAVLRAVERHQPSGISTLDISRELIGIKDFTGSFAVQRFVHVRALHARVDKLNKMGLLSIELRKGAKERRFYNFKYITITPNGHDLVQRWTEWQVTDPIRASSISEAILEKVVFKNILPVDELRNQLQTSWVKFYLSLTNLIEIGYLQKGFDGTSKTVRLTEKGKNAWLIWQRLQEADNVGS
jgi:DNA-binding MarR family transcriptional regulator